MVCVYIGRAAAVSDWVAVTFFVYGQRAIRLCWDVLSCFFLAGCSVLPLEGGLCFIAD